MWAGPCPSAPAGPRPPCARRRSWRLSTQSSRRRPSGSAAHSRPPRLRCPRWRPRRRPPRQRLAWRLPPLMTPSSCGASWRWSCRSSPRPPRARPGPPAMARTARSVTHRRPWIPHRGPLRTGSSRCLRRSRRTTLSARRRRTRRSLRGYSARSHVTKHSCASCNGTAAATQRHSRLPSCRPRGRAVRSLACAPSWQPPRRRADGWWRSTSRLKLTRNRFASG
mmetsp:Transcript_100474/g.319152  ORF Transcript_100474/g.319152 Transcript_100474/m.319152 type:complete len:223 (+) Transcript_100474:55-723(+)